MKKIVLFDSSHNTSNFGDFIIEVVMGKMRSIFEKSYLARHSTRNPLMHLYKLLRSRYISWNRASEDLKPLGGSYIFKLNLFRYALDCNINIFMKR